MRLIEGLHRFARVLPGLVFLAGTLSAAPLAAKPTVAVFDFEMGNSVQLQTSVRSDGDKKTVSVERSRQSNLLTNRLVHQLVQSGEVDVVEREKLGRIMDEARFSQSDLTDPKRAMEIGKMLGADYMIFGAITTATPSVNVQRLPYDAGIERTIGMTVAANARLVKTETGVVEASSEARVEKTESEIDPGTSSHRVSKGFQEEAYSELATKMTAQLLGTLNPIRVARQDGDKVYLARGNLPEGSYCKVSSQGEAITDPDTGEVLGRTESEVALLKISKGMKKLSIATVEKWFGDNKTLEQGALCRTVPAPEPEDGQPKQ